MPTDMFYNTGISTYIWIVSNRKPAHRKGKLQLIDASSFWQNDLLQLEILVEQTGQQRGRIDAFEQYLNLFTDEKRLSSRSRTKNDN